ncbi:MAG TPA: glycosyltransferase family 4 protein [Candidatus Paceibacterota bacterium]|nr:glycosyltransferase family 4 protein [Candidatus Paceibacterota bacterium]
MKPKLCYVLPRYETADASHFSHVHDFLKEIGNDFDLFLIVERGERPSRELGYSRFFTSRGPFRVVSLPFMLIRARLAGYCDFYIHYSFFSAFFASLIAKVSGGRVFYWNCGEPWKYKRNFLRKFFERLVYKTVTHLVTGTPSLADEYARRYGIQRASVLVMPNWIDLKRFTSALSREESRTMLHIPQDAKVVLFVHRLSPRKGSRMIVPVVSEVIRVYPDTIFIIVGFGPDERFLHDEIWGKGLEKNIYLADAVANRELPDYFSAADAFFMPSEEEGFPRVLLEAMALGIPFVASNVGAVKDIIPERMHEYVIGPGDVHGFADRIEALISKDSGERTMMGNELESWVKRYDVSPVAKVFTGLFARV